MEQPKRRDNFKPGASMITQKGAITSSRGIRPLAEHLLLGFKFF